MSERDDFSFIPRPAMSAWRPKASFVNRSAKVRMQ